MMHCQEPSLADIAALIADALSHPTVAQQDLLAQLGQLASRLGESAFQLAVLGQFKRGKSSLLNAMIGESLLTTGVLPLTSVSTFLMESSGLECRLTYDTGRVEERSVDCLEALVREIAAATTEEKNPHNMKGLKRVDIGLPGRPWLGELTLIDTPGIGSTHMHNTDAAYAVLSECDAALFVCSVDPPITEVELAYLARICRTVPHVIVVLNKVDLVDDEDRWKALDFLSAVIAERTGMEIDRRVFAVSARLALAARQRGDSAALEASGLAALERYVRTTLVDRKRDVLEQSIAGKMEEIAATLAGEAALSASASALPLAKLDDTVRAFEAAVVAFERERVGLQDALEGEWRRAVARLDGLCEAVERRVWSELEARLFGQSVCDQPGDEHLVATAVMNQLFEKEFSGLMMTVEAELTAALRLHQEQYQALAARVRETAGALLSVSFPPALPSDWFQARQQSYWTGEWRIDSLGSLTVDGLAWLLPAAIRRRREQRKFRAGVERALIRNIANLHWAMQQNIDDSFRALIAMARQAVDASIGSTRELLVTAQRRRQEQDTPLQVELEQARITERRLADLHATLRQRRVAHAYG